MHGNQHTTARWRRRATLRGAFGLTGTVVAVSNDTKRFFDGELRLRPGVLRVVPNGVPASTGDRARIRRELRLSSDELLVLATGSLVPRKGHAVLMRALAAQPAEGPLWRLAIAGRGSEQPSLEVLSRELGIEARVHLLGHRDDVGDLLAAADIFAMPSLWEGLPLALLEAMSAEKPIVASATSGIPEAIVADVDGLLTRPGDVEELAAAIHRLRIDPGLRRRLGERAGTRAREEFSIEAMTTAYEELYLAAGRRRATSGFRAWERGSLATAHSADDRGQR
jgi:glycosyltransferase involved in cell wall biosynthesis